MRDTQGPRKTGVQRLNRESREIEAAEPLPPPQYIAVEAAGSRPGTEQTLGGTLAQLWRRRWLLLSMTILGAALSGAIVYSLPPLYVGEARLLVGIQAPRVMNVQSVLAEVSPDAERVQNESFILQSRQIAASVIDQLQLQKSPFFNAELQKPSRWSQAMGFVNELRLDVQRSIFGESAAASTPHSSPDALNRERMVDVLLSRIDVAMLGRSHVLSIKAEAPEPLLAASMANAFAEQYLDFQRGEKLRSMEKVDKYLLDRISELRDVVSKSDQAVQDYRRAHGLYKSGNGSVTTQQLAELNSQLIVAQGAKVEAESRLREAQQLRKGALASESVPEVLRSPLVAALKQQLSDVERRGAETESTLGARHPQVLASRAEAGSVAARLSGEVGRIIEGLARDARAAEARYNALSAQFDAIKGQMGVVNDKSIQLEALERDAQVNRNLLEAMLNRAKQAATTGDALQANAKLISPAVPAAAPSFPPKALFLGLGSFAALLIGSGIALVLEGSDRTFRRPDQIESMTGLPVLAMVPQVKGRTASQKVVREPASPYSEALRRLALGIELSETESIPRTILFSSATPGEGKSVMVASLARLLASKGRRVLVIDCDWRSPRSHLLLRCGSGPGLAELLSDDQAVLNQCIHRDELTGADLVPAGTWHPNMSHLLTSGRMAQLLELLATTYDAVLLDCPPVLVSADALALSRMTDKAVYVVRWGHTRKETALEGLKQLLDAQADLAGIAVSRVLVKEYRRYASSANLSLVRSPMVSFR